MSTQNKKYILFLMESTPMIKTPFFETRLFFDWYQRKNTYVCVFTENYNCKSVCTPKQERETSADSLDIATNIISKYDPPIAGTFYGIFQNECATAWAAYCQWSKNAISTSTY
jgi:hypothetical protein